MNKKLLLILMTYNVLIASALEPPVKSNRAKAKVFRLEFSPLIIPTPVTSDRAKIPVLRLELSSLAVTTGDELTPKSPVSPKPRTLVRTPRSVSMLGYGEMTDEDSAPAVDLASLVLAATTGDILTHESPVDAKPRTLVQTPSLLGDEDIKYSDALVKLNINKRSLNIRNSSLSVIKE